VARLGAFEFVCPVSATRTGHFTKAGNIGPVIDHAIIGYNNESWTADLNLNSTVRYVGRELAALPAGRASLS
jgi:hypothetical protein